MVNNSVTPVYDSLFYREARTGLMSAQVGYILVVSKFIDYKIFESRLNRDKVFSATGVKSCRKVNIVLKIIVYNIASLLAVV